MREITIGAFVTAIILKLIDIFPETPSGMAFLNSALFNPLLIIIVVLIAYISLDTYIRKNKLHETKKLLKHGLDRTQNLKTTFMPYKKAAKRLYNSFNLDEAKQIANLSNKLEAVIKNFNDSLQELAEMKKDNSIKMNAIHEILADYEFQMGEIDTLKKSVASIETLLKSKNLEISPADLLDDDNINDLRSATRLEDS